jgi:hypothetical protein
MAHPEEPTMQGKLTVRFVSGREEQFEIEFAGGRTGEFRLQEFIKDPTLVLQTGTELILIPPHNVECLTLSLPKLGQDQAQAQQALENIRKAKRLK